MTSVKIIKNENTVKCLWKVFSQRCLQLLIVVPLVMTAFPASAYESDEMFCSHGGAKRKIFIKTDDAQSVLPCYVVENKRIGSPDSATSLWSAGDDAGYCKKKLVGYVERLRGLGFECWSTGYTDNARVPVIINPAK